MQIFRALFFALLFCTHFVEAGNYILRYSTIDNGGILFTGNTLVLSKAPGQNQPGTADSGGAFITTDQTQKVGNYPPGTTLSWQNDSSAAFLELPPGSTVLYAELVWSGSFGFQGQITGNEPNTPIKFTLPNGTTHSVSPDPATAQISLTPGYTNAGNYVRSQDVTSLVQAGGSGRYVTGGIAGTISAADNSHNAAGWTLEVVFHNGQMPTSDLSLFVSAQQASSTTQPPAEIEGFCVPDSGPLQGRLYVSAIEGDANIGGDQMWFGPTPSLTAANALSGTNNPINNFFASQINTLLAFDGTNFVGDGQLDTTGSFGTYNANAFSKVIYSPSRQGYDITSVDVSSQLTYGQTIAYAKGTTTSDDYTINGLGLQITIGAPTIGITKQVNGSDSVRVPNPEISPTTVNFTFTITNTGTLDATNAQFQDLLPVGLEFAGNLLVNGAPVSGDPNVGIPIGDLPIGSSVTVSFDATVTDYPTTDSDQGANTYLNSSTVNYDFSPCSGTSTSLQSSSNIVQIQLPKRAPLLVATKFVDNQKNVSASVGDTVLFTIVLNNSPPATADAFNVVLTDLLEDGLEYVPGSTTVNNVLVSGDPATGIPVGTIILDGQATVQFQATVTKLPGGSQYVNSADIDYDLLDPDTDDYTPLPSVESDVVTIDVPPAPVIFTGTARRCEFLTRTVYCVDASWVSAFSNVVLGYRIYAGNLLLLSVPATQNAAKVCNLANLQTINTLNLRAVYTDNVESVPVYIRITP